MPAAARVGDMVRQDSPHCHAPIHPPAPVPTPVPHPSLVMTIVTGAFNVLIGNQPAELDFGSGFRIPDHGYDVRGVPGRPGGWFGRGGYHFG